MTCPTGQGTGDATDPSLREIAPGAWVFEQPDGGWCLNNAGIVQGQNETLLIDTAATQGRTQRLRQSYKTVTGREPGRILLTHFHGDHSFGVGEFTETDEIIASERTSGLLAKAGTNLTRLWPNVDWGRVTVPKPNRTFSDSLQLNLGSYPVDVIELGPAHTVSDAFVWLPEHRVLYAGDLLMAGVTPFFMFGSATGMLTALQKLRDLEPLVVVSGHGPVRDAEVIEENASYVRWCLETARKGRESGLSPVDLAYRLREEQRVPDLIDSERIIGNLYRAYADLAGAAPGAAIDYQGAFSAMVAYGGGELICRA